VEHKRLIMENIKETLETPVIDRVDVLVCGGGPAGIAAAMAAARNGARTLLLEKNGFLGGIAALGIPIQGFHVAERRQIVKGIGWELAERLLREDSSSSLRFFEGMKRVYGSWIMYDKFRLRKIATDMLEEAGVGILLHTMSAVPILKGRSVVGAVTESKSGRQAVFSRMTIDASGDGDIAARSGAGFKKGNPDGYLQPVTLLFKISNVDMEEFLGDIDRRPGEYEIAVRRPRYREKYRQGERMCINGLQKLCREAQERGEFNMPNPLIAAACLPREGEVLINMAHVKLVDATSSKDLTRAEITGNRYVWQIMGFLKKYVPGFKNASVSEIMPFAGVRETRRIVCEHTLTEKEMLAGKKFFDRIGMGGRGVDIHDPTPDNSQSCRSMYLPFPKGYFIPYRSLLPKKPENILVAGRCISVSYRAFGSTRVMAQCLATGQAAGTAAALAVANNVSLKKLDIKLLQETLRKDGAIMD